MNGLPIVCAQTEKAETMNDTGALRHVSAIIPGVMADIHRRVAMCNGLPKMSHQRQTVDERQENGGSC